MTDNIEIYSRFIAEQSRKNGGFITEDETKLEPGSLEHFKHHVRNSIKWSDKLDRAERRPMKAFDPAGSDIRHLSKIVDHHDNAIDSHYGEGTIDKVRDHLYNSEKHTFSASPSKWKEIHQKATNKKL